MIWTFVSTPLTMPPLQSSHKVCLEYHSYVTAYAVRRSSLHEIALPAARHEKCRDCQAEAGQPRYPQEPVLNPLDSGQQQRPWGALAAIRHNATAPVPRNPSLPTPSPSSLRRTVSCPPEPTRSFELCATQRWTTCWAPTRTPLQWCTSEFPSKHGYRGTPRSFYRLVRNERGSLPARIPQCRPRGATIQLSLRMSS